MSQYQLPYQNYGAPSGQSNFGGAKSGTDIFGGVNDQSNPFGANAATAQAVNPVTAAVGNATAALTGTNAGPVTETSGSVPTTNNTPTQGAAVPGYQNFFYAANPNPTPVTEQSVLDWQPGGSKYEEQLLASQTPVASTTPQQQQDWWSNLEQSNPQSFAATVQGYGPHAIPYGQLNFQQRGGVGLPPYQTPEAANQLTSMTDALAAYQTQYGYNPGDLDPSGSRYMGGNSALS